jgi:hypothetical protein
MHASKKIGTIRDKYFDDESVKKVYKLYKQEKQKDK